MFEEDDRAFDPQALMRSRRAGEAGPDFSLGKAPERNLKAAGIADEAGALPERCRPADPLRRYTELPAIRPATGRSTRSGFCGNARG